MSDIRIKDLPESISIDNGDYIAIDNESTGTRKYPISDVVSKSEQAKNSADQAKTIAEQAANSSSEAVSASEEAKNIAENALEVAEMVSQTAIDSVGAEAGQVPTANGSDGWEWTTPVIESIYDEETGSVEITHGLSADADSTVVANIIEIVDDHFETAVKPLSDNVNYYGSKNILPTPYAGGETATINGITFNVNQDGSITISGTATATATFYLTGTVNNGQWIEIEEGKSYIFSYGTSGSSSTTFYVNGYLLNTKSDTRIWNTITDVTSSQFTIDTTGYKYLGGIYLRVPSGATVSTTVYPMIRLSVISDSTYSIYAMTSHEVTNRFKHMSVVNAKDFGALGNGVDDDTEAIKKALSYGAKNVVIPEGTYITSSRISIPPDTTLWAYGARIKNTDKSVSAIEIASSNVRIYGLEFTEDEEKGRNNYNTSALLIHSTSGNPISNVTIKDCYIHNTARYAINIISYKVNYIVQAECTDIHILNCRIHDVWVGVKQGHAIRTWITSCHITEAQSECITCDDGTEDSTIDGCFLKNNYGGIGLIGCDDSKRSRIINNIFNIDNWTESSSYKSSCNGICFNQHTGTNVDMVISDNVFRGARYSVLARDEAGYTDLSIENLVIINNVFFNSALADISLEQISGKGRISNNTHYNVNTDTWLVVASNYSSAFSANYIYTDDR